MTDNLLIERFEMPVYYYYYFFYTQGISDTEGEEKIVGKLYFYFFTFGIYIRGRFKN